MRKCSLVVMLGIILSTIPVGVNGATVNYPNLGDLSGFTLGSRAAELNRGGDSILHLISGTWQQGGYAFLTPPVLLGDSFSTCFSFQITNNVGGGDSDGLGADWLMFAINTEAGYFRDSGQGIYVEYDIFNNGERDHNSGNHVGINIHDKIGNQEGFVAVQHVGTRFNNGCVWHSWIDYDGEFLDIYASMNAEKPNNPYLSYRVDVLDLFQTRTAYVGFHAASGAYGADFDVLNWSFSTPEAVPEPCTMPLLGSGLAGFVALRKARYRNLTGRLPRQEEG